MLCTARVVLLVLHGQTVREAVVPTLLIHLCLQRPLNVHQHKAVVVLAAPPNQQSYRVGTYVTNHQSSICSYASRW